MDDLIVEYTVGRYCRNPDAAYYGACLKCGECGRDFADGIRPNEYDPIPTRRSETWKKKDSF